MLTSQGCYNSDISLSSQKNIDLAERAVLTLKHNENFSKMNIGWSLGKYFGKFLCSCRKSANARGRTPERLLFGRSLRNLIFGFYNVGLKVVYKPTVCYIKSTSQQISPEIKSEELWTFFGWTWRLTSSYFCKLRKVHCKYSVCLRHQLNHCLNFDRHYWQTF